jgi:hypothetical protein
MSVLKFQIYMMFDNDSALGYPYIAKCDNIKRCIYIGKDHVNIEIMHQNDRLAFHEQYIATSRYFDCDVEKLDSLVENIIGQREDYGLTAYFDKAKELVISYRDKKDNEYRERELTPEIARSQNSKDCITLINHILVGLRNLPFE